MCKPDIDLSPFLSIPSGSWPCIPMREDMDNDELVEICGGTGICDAWDKGLNSSGDEKFCPLCGGVIDKEMGS